jgi:LytS/YehU family sensor histidine kinase
MKSTDRIIKDIRYYEIKPKDFTEILTELLVMFTKLLTVQIQLVNELQEN